MQCVILAGGLGTRMRPRTDQMPKSLLPALGTPFLHYQLEWLSRAGVRDIVLCIGHLGDQIKAYAADGKQWGVTISYVDDGDRPLGTGGALRLAADERKLSDEFFVQYGDSFLPVDFGAIWREWETREEPALMTVLKNDGRWDTSNVCFDGKLVTLYDKSAGRKPPDMRYIDFGLSIFSGAIVEREIPPGQACDLSAVCHRLSVRRALAGYEVHTRFYEIGSPSGLADFERYLIANKGGSNAVS